MAEEMEVEMEVEAVEAVYGPDCAVFCVFPPHLSISLKPRTADDLYIQFVEAKLIIKASAEYPNEPPKLELKDAKGLGDNRHAKLLEVLDAEAKEMSGEPMLVAICEVATDMLTQMNVPDGDCCFCMNPFMMDDGAQPFMKLMSCFHCFHSDCFGNWWRWLQQQRERSSGAVSVARSDHRNIVELEDFPVNCPVCRMAVNAEDVAHVRQFLTATRKLDSVQSEEAAKVPAFVLTVEELERRARFSAEFEAQQARGAIIEPKKLEVILPGMIVPPRTPPIEEQPPVPTIYEENQPSPSSTIDSPVPFLSSACDTNTVGSSHTGFGSPKEHSHQDNDRQSRGRKGRRGGNSRGSHVGWRKHHGGHKAKEDHSQHNSTRQHSHPSRHQPPLVTSEGGQAPQDSTG